MASLVADYGDSSSSSSTETEDDDEEIGFKGRGNASSSSISAALINPFRSSQHTQSQQVPISSDQATSPPLLPSSTSISVFSNPYREAENAKQSILEKHVKMTPNLESQTTINGRQVCWNYRKGRCRFGHNCKFAHDSDLVQNSSSAGVNEVSSSTYSSPAVMAENEVVESQRKRKKRPGLSETLVPSKKVMKSFYKQQRQETPYVASK